MNRVEEWATCFRTECDISTNMKLESFHKVLKYLFLDKKANKRTDKLIHTLLAYSNWKQFDVLIGSSKEINDRFVPLLEASTDLDRHKCATSVPYKVKLPDWSQ
uniref:Uncharacterized protein n=1 Tax=Ornithodoros parkeri TaxID=140564 RepID=A6N9W4_ORNPR|nr:hypothetical protein [Ornithodoros parkeri]